MTRLTHKTAVLLTITTSATTLFLLLAYLSHSAVHAHTTDAISDAPKSEIRNPQSQVSDPFSATLTITTDRETVVFPEELEVTVDLDVVEGCQYPVFELTLMQIGADGALFSHIDPPTSIVGPPMTFPITYRLLAIRPGQVNLRAQTYGERYCNDYWNWRYLWSSPQSITVRGDITQFYLPFQYAE